MKTALVQRNIPPSLREAMLYSPVIVISGARQVGKSTLIQRMLEGTDHRLVNLDSAATREAAQLDPDGFATQYPDGILAIDEVQCVP